MHSVLILNSILRSEMIIAPPNYVMIRALCVVAQNHEHTVCFWCQNAMDWIYRKVVDVDFYGCIVQYYHILQNGVILDNFFHLIFTLNTYATKWAVESDTVVLLCILAHSQLVVILFIALLVWWLSFIIYSTVKYTLKTEKLIWQKQIKNKNKNNKNLVENTSYTWKKTEQLHASPNFDRSFSCIS